MNSASLAVTLGEPAGIGPDITIAAWWRRQELNLPPFYVLGNTDCLARRAKAIGIDLPVETIAQPEAATAVFSRALPVIDIGPATAAPGRSSPIRSQRACSTMRALLIPATPNFSPSLRQKTTSCPAR